jgi:sugar phosphate isomerase/epimerase
VKPVLALSTSWCSQRHQDGYAMLREMADLGFEHVELSHGIRITLVPGILRAVKEGVVKISSTHNFCPLPVGVMHAAPNLYEPSASGFQEHEQWVRYTKRTIDFAAQVNARVVVCHLGSVKFFWFNPAERIARYLKRRPEAGRAFDDRRYQGLREKCLTKLRDRMPPFWTRVESNLRGMLAYAGEKGVKLGCENRERFDELPVDEDLPGWLAGFGANAPLGYWHDTGHAHLKEGMGLLRHEEHLAALAARTIGFHLHDVNAEGRDHQVLGSGGIDFKMISRFWRPEHLLVLELGPRATADDVRTSRLKIEALLG